MRLQSKQRHFLEFVLNRPEVTKKARINHILSEDGYAAEDTVYLNLLRDYYKLQYHTGKTQNPAEFIKSRLSNVRFNSGGSGNIYTIVPNDTTWTNINWYDMDGKYRSVRYKVTDVIQYLMSDDWKV